MLTLIYGECDRVFARRGVWAPAGSRVRHSFQDPRPREAVAGPLEEAKAAAGADEAKKARLGLRTVARRRQ